MDCPLHFSFNPEGTSVEDFCLPTCPPEFYTKTAYLTNWYMQGITSTLLMPITIFAFFPYIFLYRRWEKALEITMFFLLFVFTLRFSFPLFKYGSHFEKLVCSSDVEVADKNQGWCLFSFLVGYFVAMVGSWVWLSFCLRLCVIINKLFKINQKYWYLGTMIWAVGYTLISIIIVLAKNKVEGDPNTMGCFISSTENNGWYIDGLWFIPITVIMGVGVILMIFSIIRILIIARPTIKGFLKSQWRMIAFVLFYTYAILCFIIFRFTVRAETPRINRSVVHWYTCFATTNGTDCGSPAVPHYGITTWVAYGLILAAVDFCLIFLVGNRDIPMWWLWKLKLTSEPRFSGYSLSGSDATKINNGYSNGGSNEEVDSHGSKVSTSSL
jgi:hypothetical protein